MRYIFTAAIGTLLVIAALLALPPIGDTDSSLVPQTAGDRLAVPTQEDSAGTDTVNTASRAVVSPDSDSEQLVLAEVLGEVESSQSLSSLIDDAASTTTAVISEGSTSLTNVESCLLYTSPSPRDQRGSRMPSSA